MTNVSGTIDDLSAKLLEVEVRFRRPWMLDRQFYLCTITLAMLGTFVFPTEHISNPSQVPIVSDEICQKPKRVQSDDPKVTYLYISGIITIPKQSECNVNSYNKDTVAFCKCECPDLIKQLILQDYGIFICKKC